MVPVFEAFQASEEVQSWGRLVQEPQWFILREGTASQRVLACRAPLMVIIASRKTTSQLNPPFTIHVGTYFRHVPCELPAVDRGMLGVSWPVPKFGEGGT